MNEQQFLIDLVFKPSESGNRLRPQEMQLLLACTGEILKELEAEEQRMIEELSAASQEQEIAPCK